MRVEVLLRYLTNVQKFAALPAQSSCSILLTAPASPLNTRLRLFADEVTSDKGTGR